MNKYIAKYLIYNIGQYFRREPVKKYLKEIEKSQYLSIDKLKLIQQDKLAKLISHAKKNIPFYNEYYKGLEYSLNGNIVNLKKFPTISKENLRNDFDEMCFLKKPFLITKKTTGGSTGQTVITLKDRCATAYSRAMMYRGYRWAGIDIGDKQVRFWGVPLNFKLKVKYKMVDYFMNRMRLSAFNFSEQDLICYYKKIKKFKPIYFYGYTSMLYEFASFLKKQNINGRELKLKAVISTSEVLYPFQKKLIEKVFGCRVYNEYGCGEFGPIAFECEKGQMHINMENVLVEIIKGKNVVKPGEVGEIVITELNNYVMPLIRYKMGDMGSISNKTCSCGRGLPILQNIIGRCLDFIITSDNKRVHGEYFNYLMEEIQNKTRGIKQFQVVQTKIGEINFKIVKDVKYSEQILNYLDKQLKGVLGEDMRINYIYVDKIERLKSGKLRLVVSEL